jgi:hypothetical protein
MNIGPPVEISISQDPDDGEICAEMYDANGLCCGSVGFLKSGVVLASLLSGNNEIIARDRFDANEET